MVIWQQILMGALLAAVAACSAYLLKMLSISGVLAAFFLGALVFGLGGLNWALILLTFFFTSSSLSLFFKRHKTSAEKEYSKGSRRDYAQVLANGGIAGLFIILHLIVPESILPWFGFCAAFAAANADTWATELGILNRRKPKLIHNGMEVEAGTSGAVSLAGTSAAAAGSLLIAALSWILTPVKDPFLWLFALMVFIGGVGGSLLDSWLGATVQAIYYCPKCQKDTEKHPLHSCGSSTTLLRGLHWFNNDMVNLCCTLGGSIPVVLMTLFIPVF